MGSKGGGVGRVGYGSGTSKGPKHLGGSTGAGGSRRTGLNRAARLDALAAKLKGGKTLSLASLQRQAGLTPRGALAAADRMVKAGAASYTHLSSAAAATLRSNGRSVAVRGGLPVRGLKGV